MPFTDLYKNVFNTNGSDTGTSHILQQLVKEYPYFSLGHFFMLQQTNINDEQYNSIAAKTALHFNNPFLLHEQLYKNTNDFYEDEEVENDTTVCESTGEVILDTAAEDTAIVEAVAENKVLVNEQNIFFANETSQQPTVPAAQQDAEIIQTNVIKEPAFEEIDAANGETIANATIKNKFLENSEHIDVINISDKNLQDVPFYTKEQASIKIETITTAQLLKPEISDDNAQPITETLAKINAPVYNEEPLVFEPLFATDYFASQGIKLRDEVMPADKLGKQLKSFTDWLKTMKKVHESKLPAGNEVLDFTVQSLAEKSNNEEDVITETMADVFLQQGKFNKAKEIYEKLSLLNPSKNAYFAAKIEQIK